MGGSLGLPGARAPPHHHTASGADSMGTKPKTAERKNTHNALCDRCGVAGHPKSECPHRLGVCGLCKKTGHLDSVCRSVVAKDAPKVDTDVQQTILGMASFTWRCRACGEIHMDPKDKTCPICKTQRQRPKGDLAKPIQLMATLEKAGTETVARLSAATGPDYPISQDNKEALAGRDKILSVISHAKSIEADHSEYDAKLKTLKTPDVSTKPFADRATLDARLLELETK